MLVAFMNKERIEAREASRGAPYSCPNCDKDVILKNGRIKISHFAHKAKQSCEWSVGETLAHLQGKSLIAEAFRSRGMKAEVEYVVSGRRADVMVWKNDRPVAIELQHTSIDLREIEKRSFDYGKQNITQIWMPFIKPEAIDAADKNKDGSLTIQRYSPRPFERWIHGLHGGKIYFYQTGSYLVWEGEFKKHEIWVKESSWYENGEEVFAGGYHRISKRWKNLILRGPYNLFNAPIIITERIKWGVEGYNWPAATLARFRL